MWLLDFLVSITIPFVALIAALWLTQWLLSRTGVRDDHPTFKAEAEKLVEAQTAAKRYAMFELDPEAQHQRDLNLEIEIQRMRQRMPGI